jgi:hypothetical protein
MTTPCLVKSADGKEQAVLAWHFPDLRSTRPNGNIKLELVYDGKRYCSMMLFGYAFCNKTWLTKRLAEISLQYCLVPPSLDNKENPCLRDRSPLPQRVDIKFGAARKPSVSKNLLPLIKKVQRVSITENPSALEQAEKNFYGKLQALYKNDADFAYMRRAYVGEDSDKGLSEKADDNVLMQFLQTRDDAAVSNVVLDLTAHDGDPGDDSGHNCCGSSSSSSSSGGGGGSNSEPQSLKTTRRYQSFDDSPLDSQ